MPSLWSLTFPFHYPLPILQFFPPLLMTSVSETSMFSMIAPSLIAIPLIDHNQPFSTTNHFPQLPRLYITQDLVSSKFVGDKCGTQTSDGSLSIITY
ncbi:hypothetical protein IHE45_16G049400 [Dioscorea alata]|uniref:Uncharacterized protein n=1 Tax=Dioscorea alata TaxID=55571 RepID=A0ACB7UHG0_DIOAL|nr:hypothetical protein IHE45_16G049400 [Dioscorea alata]